jgi:16S rRNA (uracil1498-N3)-methyltransferase
LEGVSLAATDCHIPNIIIERNFKRFIHQDLDKFFDNKVNHIRLVAHPPNDQQIKNHPVSFSSFKKQYKLSSRPNFNISDPPEILIAVGGEGGWHEQELSIMNENRFHAVHLGERIMRSDIAVRVIYNIIFNFYLLQYIRLFLCLQLLIKCCKVGTTMNDKSCS